MQGRIVKRQVFLHLTRGNENLIAKFIRAVDRQPRALKFIFGGRQHGLQDGGVVTVIHTQKLSRVPHRGFAAAVDDRSVFGDAVDLAREFCEIKLRRCFSRETSGCFCERSLQSFVALS